MAEDDALPVYARSQDNSPLRQGEVISDIAQIILLLETVGLPEPRVRDENHQFAIVLSQDCDLEQDWNARQTNGPVEGKPDPRLLSAVLFAPVHDATELKRAVANDGIWKRARQNKNERYQFLAAARADQDSLGRGFPELGIDFKRYFTIPTGEVYKRLNMGARRRCRLVSPYLEHLSTRFCYYQFRVALPVDHHNIAP